MEAPATERNYPLEINADHDEAEDTTASIEEAIRSFNTGDYETALRLFMEASARNAAALTGAGLAYYKLGRYREAIRSLEDALQTGEEEFVTRKFLAMAYYKTDELEKSIRHAEHALAIREDSELQLLHKKLSSELRAQSNRVDEATLHFKVIFDGYEHGDMSRTVLGILEDAYRSLGRKMDHFPLESVTVVLYTRKEFFDVTRLPAFTAGAYDGKIRLPIKGLEEQNQETLRHVLFHEYAHALVQSMTPNAPLWVNEGLAEYLAPRGLERTGQVIPLASLERSFPMDDQRLTTIAYMESFSAVSDLIEEYGIYRLREFLFSLGRGEDVDQAFSSSFFISYRDFVSKWGK